METKEILVGALAACETRESLEYTFEIFKATDLSYKIECLNKCMGDPKTFFSSGEQSTLEDKYEITVGMFLTGAWKLARKYEKLRN